MEVSIRYAKTHLAELIDKTILGEEVVITRDGTPVVRLARMAPVAGKRELGTARGKILFTDGWDAPMTRKESESFTGA